MKNDQCEICGTPNCATLRLAECRLSALCQAHMAEFQRWLWDNEQWGAYTAAVCRAHAYEAAVRAGTLKPEEAIGEMALPAFRAEFLFRAVDAWITTKREAWMAAQGEEHGKNGSA